MDRNREPRRSSAMAASTNGVSRRRHRSTSLRDSPEEEGPGEMHETGRLRDRVVKKDRDRVSRSKRRRNEDESSEESVNDEVEDDEDDGGAVRMLPPHPAVTNHHHGHQNQQHVSRSKGVPPASAAVNNKAFRSVQGWKPADEVIGFSVPRKARSASTKRSHENWVSGSGATPEQIHRQTSPSPSPAPLSPSSSNVSVRKKLKPNGSKQKPPKSGSKASSSNPEELEIEIAEVLYGLMTQSQAPSEKEADSPLKVEANRRNEESRSRVSSPISNSASTAPQMPQNSSSSAIPFSAVAPKRKKPRQVSENLSSLGARNSPISSTMVKSEIDQPPKTDNLLPNSAKSPVSISENSNIQSLPPDFTGLDIPAKEMPEPARSPGSEFPVVKLEDSHGDVAVTKVSEMEIQREDKFEIDLMAPPERESDNDFAAVAEPEPVLSVSADALQERSKDEKACKQSCGDEMLVEEPELKKAKLVSESAQSDKAMLVKERNIDLQLNLEKSDRDKPESLSGNSKSHPHVEKPQQPQVKVSKDEHSHTEKAALPTSLPLPMSLASWPGGLPPMGYMAPLQGSMDGSQVPPTPVQPLFSQPRPKRCATHCYIARNIHCLQQFMKMNPFWPAAAAGPTSVFGARPCSNLNVVHSTELHGRAISSVQDKGTGLAIFPGHVGKEKASQSANIADAQRKQPQITLQQALPPGASASNMLHGPAIIFPFNQQQAAAAVAAASVLPGPAMSPGTAPNSAPVSVSTSVSMNGSASAAPAPAPMSFNYPNMPSNETQYLAILQNNAYPFPITAPTYRGTHPQPIPFFNGSFYTSQMIHPSQFQQHPSSQPQQQIQPGQQKVSVSSGSSLSQKQNLQGQQQRPEQGIGNLSTFPAPKTRAAQSSQPHQARNVETEVGNQDSPSTADSRTSRGPMSVYGPNFSMPIHQNFALVSSSQALAGSSNGNNTQGKNKKQQHSQQQGLKAGGVESIPQTFAMSFASMNGGNTSSAGIDLSSVAQNHAVFQNFSEADKRNYQVMQAAAVAQAAQQRKNIRVVEEGKNSVGGDSSKMDEEKKGLAPKASVTSGQSIAFTRPDLTDPSVSPLMGTNVIDSSARNLNPASSANNQRGSRSSITNSSQLGQLQNVQFQQQHVQQQMVQIQKQQQLQQQFDAARSNKMHPMPNGSFYGDRLSTSSPSAASKFPNTISGFPQNVVPSGANNSPSQSPQWKNSARAGPQVQSPSTSSLKNLPQQQQARPQQSHTQISFGSGQKPQTGPHGQQPQSTNQSSSPPMGVSSPTSSLSKGAGGSPRTPSSNSAVNKASSLSSQQSKNPASAPCHKTPSILGNPHNMASSNSGPKSLVQQQQQQLPQQQLKQMASHQPQMFFSPAYMQTHPPQSTSNPGNTGRYYLQKQYSDKQQQQQQGGSPSGTSTGMLSLCTPVTAVSSSNAEVKAGSSAVNSNTKGPSQSILQHPQFQAQSSGSFSYMHTVPAGVQVKPTPDQKQPAGNREPTSRK